MRDYVALRALCDVTLGVGVETRPGDMTLKDVGQPFVARMACKFAAMGIFENVRHQYRRDDGLQDRQVGCPTECFPQKDVILNDETFEVGFVVSLRKFLRWTFLLFHHLLDFMDDGVIVLCFGQFLPILVE